MFEGINWSNALKRATIFTVIWLALVYVMHTINPKFFKLGNSNDILLLGLNAALFFVVYTVFFGFMERRKNRTQNQKTSGNLRAKEGRTHTTKDGEEMEGGRYKGQVNPNTSRKKASRRRR